MPNQVFVMSATGNVGKNVVDMLQLINECSVVIGTRNPENAEDFEDENTEIRKFDFQDPSTFTSAFDGCDAMFLNVPSHPTMAHTVPQILTEAKKAGVKFIAKLGVSGANPNAPTFFAKQHGMADNAVRESGIEFCSLNPVEFMDNYLNFQGATIKSSGSFYLPQGNATKSLVSCVDIGEAFAEVLLDPNEYAGKSLPIAGFDYTNAEIASILSIVLQKQITYVDVTEEVAEQSLRSMGSEDWFVKAMMELNSLWKKGMMVASNEPLIEILGRYPQSFEQFARENKEAFLP
ncbi:MAG: NmrA family NAD(P)-binding protein [Candidatus Kapabacteria bacterium]|nr:NmrA family NAD(P)-binding protein [Candidatus Kapabacteria bacterium]